MAKIRKGDQVIVIAGKEKGKQGTVLSVSNDRVKVEGLNLVKKHQKPNRATGAEGAVLHKKLRFISQTWQFLMLQPKRLTVLVTK
jgi:ribosomal protein L24